MTEEEIKFLTKELIEKAGFDPEHADVATDLFVKLHGEEVSKVTYSQSGIQTLSTTINTWKETDTGKRFLPQESPKNIKQRTLKEITEDFKNGKLKFQAY